MRRMGVRVQEGVHSRSAPAGLCVDDGGSVFAANKGGRQRAKPSAGHFGDQASVACMLPAGSHLRTVGIPPAGIQPSCIQPSGVADSRSLVLFAHIQQATRAPAKHTLPREPQRRRRLAPTGGGSASPFMPPAAAPSQDELLEVSSKVWCMHGLLTAGMSTRPPHATTPSQQHTPSSMRRAHGALSLGCARPRARSVAAMSSSVSLTCVWGRLRQRGRGARGREFSALRWPTHLAACRCQLGGPSLRGHPRAPPARRYPLATGSHRRQRQAQLGLHPGIVDDGCRRALLPRLKRVLRVALLRGSAGEGNRRVDEDEG